MVQLRLRRGKGDFIRKKLSDGTIEDVCLAVHNADFSIRGCIAQVPGELIDEVISNNGRYSKETKKRFRSQEDRKLPDLRCFYCYDRRKNWGQVTPVTIGDSTIQDFEKLKPNFVRLGKSTEAGHIFYHPLLIEFLELCKNYQTRVIFPTKMLPFDTEIAKLLRDTNSVLQFSIGTDSLEPGACSQGYTNSWRISQAQLYNKANINTSLTIICDITQSIEKNAKAGFSLVQALETPDIPKRILPLRPNSNKVSSAITKKLMSQITHKPLRHTSEKGYQQISGLEDCIIDSDEEAARISGRHYLRKGNNELIPIFLHPDFEHFRQVPRICGRIGNLEYCDKCTLCPPVEPFPASQLVKVEYSIKRKNGWREYRRYKSRKRKKLQPDLPGLFDS